MTISTITVTKVRVKVLNHGGSNPWPQYPKTLIVDDKNHHFIVQDCTQWSSRQIVDWCGEQGVQIVNLIWVSNKSQPAFRGL